LIILRGTCGGTIEVLVDNVSRGTASASGTDLDVGAGDFTIGHDATVSYNYAGQVRYFAACAKRLGDDVLATLQMMLEYEGYFDIFGDDFAKWTGSEALSGGTNTIGDSYLSAFVTDPA
jgi:hypothetical protein